jgi:excisionase family DNA binding protein
MGLPLEGPITTIHFNQSTAPCGKDEESGVNMKTPKLLAIEAEPVKGDHRSPPCGATQQMHASELTCPDRSPYIASMQAHVAPSDAAKYLGVSEQTLAIWRCTKRYALNYIKVGRLVRYRVTDLDTFLEQRTVVVQHGDQEPTFTESVRKPCQEEK